MSVAAFAAVSFLFALSVHWVWWRVRIPRRPVPALLAILLGTFPLAWAAAYLL